MKKLEFSIEINATKEKVWESLWEDQNYRNWTAVFHEGSHYKGDLQEGNKVYFLGPNKDGMYAMVKESIPFEKMYFQHIGEFKGGVEQEPIFGDEAIENYDLSEKDGVTTLIVTMNMVDEYVPYFASTFPKALEKIKEISEK